MQITLLAATTLGLAVLVAACSGAGATTAPTTAPTAAPTEAPSVEAPASPAAGGAASVALADNALGKIVVDGAGMTLYVFTPDARRRSRPAAATAPAAGRRWCPRGCGPSARPRPRDFTPVQA